MHEPDNSKRRDHKSEHDAKSGRDAGWRLVAAERLRPDCLSSGSLRCWKGCGNWILWRDLSGRKRGGWRTFARLSAAGTLCVPWLHLITTLRALHANSPFRANSWELAMNERDSLEGVDG